MAQKKIKGTSKRETPNLTANYGPKKIEDPSKNATPNLTSNYGPKN